MHSLGMCGCGAAPVPAPPPPTPEAAPAPTSSKPKPRRCVWCRRNYPKQCDRCIREGVVYDLSAKPPAPAPEATEAAAQPPPPKPKRRLFLGKPSKNQRKRDEAEAQTQAAAAIFGALLKDDDPAVRKQAEAAVKATAAVNAALGAQLEAAAAAPAPPPAAATAAAPLPEPMTVLRSALADQAAIILARRKLSWFVRLAFGKVLKPGTQLVWAWYLDAICDHLQAVFEDWLIAKGLEPPTLPGLRPRVEARWRAHGLEPQAGKVLVQNLAMNLAPGTLKSVITMVCFPAWVWLHYPAFEWGCSSGSPGNVTRDSDAHRDLVVSAWYRETFNITWKVRDDVDSKEKWQTTAGGYRLSRGMKARWTGVHVDALLLDDPDDAFAVFGDASRRDVQGQWRDAMENRINDPEFSFRVIVQQHVHVDDLTNHLLSLGIWSADDAVTRARWDKLEIAMEFIPSRRHKTAYGWEDPRLEAGAIMHPERFSPEYLASKREKLGSYGYEAQYNQNAELLDGGMFQRSWFKFFRVEGEEQGTRPRPPLCRQKHDPQAPDYDPGFILVKREGELAVDFLALSVDATFGSTNAAASNVGLLAVAGQANRRFILDDKTKARTFLDTKRDVVDMIGRWKPSKVLIEKKANGAAVIEELEAAIAEAKIVDREGKPVVCVLEPITPQNDGGGKVGRAAAAMPAVEAGLVHVLDGASWADDFIGEVCAFPNGKKDDRVDALTQALNFYRGALSSLQRWEAMAK